MIPTEALFLLEQPGVGPQTRDKSPDHAAQTAWASMSHSSTGNRNGLPIVYTKAITQSRPRWVLAMVFRWLKAAIPGIIKSSDLEIREKVNDLDHKDHSFKPFGCFASQPFGLRWRRKSR
jgi:hypothetical protein